MKIRKEKDFVSCFDEKTGVYFRTGKQEPFMASFPELLDIGIMGHCKHGKLGLCAKAGVECYQDGLHAEKENMSLEDFKSIVEQCKNDTYQIALGGCGDPDCHEEFEKILKVCKEAEIVPNFTTSGLGMTAETAQICKKYCGAVAVSWYRSAYTVDAINKLISAGVKTNIHYVLSKSTVLEAMALLKNERKFPKGINAVIFLLHKPIGLGTPEEMITKENEDFWKLLKYIDDTEFPFKIGFDSCTVPALISLKHVNDSSIDTCEGGRWSAYISADMKMMPCSFDNQSERWAVSLREYTIKEAWNSRKFEDFREHLRKKCPNCDKRELCMGGCPIVPEIVVCQNMKH
ncbi:MAG: SPASM domain-containing protein [Lachnospiraceae bacterium]|nr:SPASM domain-containing protein [Lachnospiraceae bacterium]